MTKSRAGLSLLNIPTHTEVMNSIWCDEKFLDACMSIERAWVAASISEGLAPEYITVELDEAIDRIRQNSAFMAERTDAIGRPVAPLVDALSADASDDLQRVLHLGLTTQDVIDGAMTLLRAQAVEALMIDIDQCLASLRRMAEAHKITLMLGRTNLQAAAPMTFGLFLAEAAAELGRGTGRIRTRKQLADTITFSGAVGLSSPFGDKSEKVRHRAALDLGLIHDTAVTSPPRDRVVDLIVALGLLAKCLERIARTISQLQSDSIGELTEREAGTSSAMPHKKNPRKAERVVMLGGQADGLIVNLMSATQTLHQRSGESWMAEWAGQEAMFQTVHAQILGFQALIDALVVEEDRMNQNVADSGLSTQSDRLFTALSREIGRSRAKNLVNEALTQKIEMPELTDFLTQHVSQKSAELLAHECGYEAVLKSASSKQDAIMETLAAVCQADTGDLPRFSLE